MPQPWVKKFVTDSNNPFYIFFPKGDIKDENSGIGNPLFVLTEMEFDELAAQMTRQRTIKL